MSMKLRTETTDINLDPEEYKKRIKEQELRYQYEKDKKRINTHIGKKFA